MMDFLNLLNFNSPRVTKYEFSKAFNKGVVEELKVQGLITEEKEKPLECEICSSELVCIEENEKIIMRCTNDDNHYKEASIDKYIIYNINYEKMIEKVFEKKINFVDYSSFRVIDNFYNQSCSFDKNRVSIVFSPSKRIYEADLFNALSNSIIGKTPTILIVKSTDENIKAIDAILLKLPLGNLLYPFYLEDFKNSKVINGLKEWLNDINNLQELERTILSRMKEMNEKRFELINCIDTNPKYLLAFLTKIKTQKLRGGNEYSDFENALSITFRSIYSSAIQYGGTEQTGERVPDNVFFVRKDGKPCIACIVDSKLSYSADLSREKTEKYEHYMKKVREHNLVTCKKALIFVVLKEKTKYSIEEFFDRLDDRLEKDEYCVILPIQFLEILIYIYLGCTIRGKINLSQEDLNAILEKLFDNEFLKANYEIKKGLYKLEPKVLIEELKRKSIKTTVFENIFSELFGEYTAK